MKYLKYFSFTFIPSLMFIFVNSAKYMEIANTLFFPYNVVFLASIFLIVFSLICFPVFLLSNLKARELFILTLCIGFFVLFSMIFSAEDFYEMAQLNLFFSVVFYFLTHVGFMLLSILIAALSELLFSTLYRKESEISPKEENSSNSLKIEYSMTFSSETEYTNEGLRFLESVKDELDIETLHDLSKKVERLNEAITSYHSIYTVSERRICGKMILEMFEKIDGIIDEVIGLHDEKHSLNIRKLHKLL